MPTNKNTCAYHSDCAAADKYARSIGRPRATHVQKPQDGSMRVWHIPQVPGKPFYVEVATPIDAKRIIKILAEYDLFQYENKIKPDYASASGLEIYEGGEWIEWENDDGESILDTMREERK